MELEKLPQGENGRGSLWIPFILLFLWKVFEKENCNFFPFPMQFPLLLHPYLRRMCIPTVFLGYLPITSFHEPVLVLDQSCSRELGRWFSCILLRDEHQI